MCVCVFAHTSHLFDLSHPSCASPLNSNISDILCVIGATNQQQQKKKKKRQKQKKKNLSLA